MSSPSSSSEHLDFNFNRSPTGPFSSGYSSESDTCLDFTPFDYLTISNNILSDPPLHENDEVFMGPSEVKLISLPVIPRSRNTYLVTYSDFSIVFFDLFPVFILYYEFLI